MYPEAYYVIPLIIFILILIYVVVNLHNKLDKSIDSYNELVDSISERDLTYQKLIKNLLDTYTNTYTTLKRVDRRGSFESDDEIGFVFKNIKNTIFELTEYIKKINEEIVNAEAEDS